MIGKVNYLASDIVVPRWRMKFEVGQGCLSEQSGRTRLAKHLVQKMVSNPP